MLHEDHDDDDVIIIIMVEHEHEHVCLSHHEDKHINETKRCT